MFESWQRGWAYLFGDDLVSYYSFFTVIFTEIAFIWGSNLDINLMLYTSLLIGCVLNVLLTAYLKGSWLCENRSAQRVSSLGYVLIYISLFLIGYVNNAKVTYILFGIPFLYAGVFTILRENDLLYTLQFVLIAVPILAFGYFLLKIEMLWSFKAILFTVFILLAPIWADIEDSWATKTIFEMVYDNDWW